MENMIDFIEELQNQKDFHKAAYIKEYMNQKGLLLAIFMKSYIVRSAFC